MRPDNSSVFFFSFFLSFFFFFFILRNISPVTLSKRARNSKRNVTGISRSLVVAWSCHTRVTLPPVWDIIETVGALSPVKTTKDYTSRLKTNFDLFPSYSFHKSLYYKSLFLKPQPKFYPQFRNANPEKKKGKKTITHVLKPSYIPRALNTGTCIQQGDLLNSAGLHRNRC